MGVKPYLVSFELTSSKSRVVVCSFVVASPTRSDNAACVSARSAHCSAKFAFSPAILAAMGEADWAIILNCAAL